MIQCTMNELTRWQHVLLQTVFGCVTGVFKFRNHSRNEKVSPAQKWTNISSKFLYTMTWLTFHWLFRICITSVWNLYCVVKIMVILKISIYQTHFIFAISCGKITNYTRKGIFLLMRTPMMPHNDFENNLLHSFYQLSSGALLFLSISIVMLI